MRVATRFLIVLCAFAALAGVVYWLITEEAVGTVLLLGYALMPAIVVGPVGGALIVWALAGFTRESRG